MPAWAVLLIVLAVAIAAIVVMYIFGKRAQKKQDEAREQMEQQKQRVDLLVIDKKKVRLKDSGLPQAAIDQANRLAKISKVPVIKCKIGPKIMNLLADGDIYESIPVKKEIRAEVAGLYILRIQGLHGTVIQAPKKKKFGARMREKAANLQNKSEQMSSKPVKKAKDEKWAAKANASRVSQPSTQASAETTKTSAQPAKSSTSGMSKSMKKKKKK